MNSLAEQYRVDKINGTARSQEEIHERAVVDANYAIFTEDSKARDALSRMKQIPGVGDVLNIQMPFTGVPTNITKRMLEYSPLGLAEVILRRGMLNTAIQKNTFDQRGFVMGMARGLTSTALYGLGYLLAKAGIIMIGTKNEDDDKRRGVETAMGGQYTLYILNPFTGECINLAVFAPAVSALMMGATAYELIGEDEDVSDALLNA